MFIRFLLIIFCLSMMIASANANIKIGVKYYNNRHFESKGSLASNNNIDKAINQFLSVINEPKHEREAALYLLKSYYYKGEFAIKVDDIKKEVFKKGKALGEKYIEKFPESPEFRYWYLVNLGSWAKVYGIFTAAKEGVADIMRENSKKIIDLDPNYRNGGGYFMLGAVHYKSPYIPFILSWPDNDEAIKYLQLAVNTGKSELNQKNYLAKALNKNGKSEAAILLLKEVINSKPSKANLVEDLDDIEEAKEILEDI